MTPDELEPEHTDPEGPDLAAVDEDADPETLTGDDYPDELEAE